jgi:hypothetical protein
MSKTKGAGNGNERSRGEVPECFVIMPITDPDGYAPGHFRRVFEDLFAPACEQSGYRAVRADNVRQTNLIHLDILQRIIDSPMAICDLSSRNPNVLFELGLRQAFDKPVVLVQEAGTPAIFDIAPMRITTYRREMLYRDVIADQAELAGAIAATRDSAADAKSVNSIVRLLGLTHAASLTAPAEGDETVSLLRVMMSELSNVKAQIATLQAPSDTRELRARVEEAGGRADIDPLTRHGLQLLEEAGNARRQPAVVLKLLQAKGFVNGFSIVYLVPRAVMHELIVANERFAQFCNSVVPNLTKPENRNFQALIGDEARFAKLAAMYDQERAALMSFTGPTSSPSEGGEG